MTGQTAKQKYSPFHKKNACYVEKITKIIQQAFRIASTQSGKFYQHHEAKNIRQALEWSEM